MLNLYAFIMTGTEQNNNIKLGLRVMQNPGFTYLHSAKRHRNAASLRLPA